MDSVGPESPALEEGRARGCTLKSSGRRVLLQRRHLRGKEHSRNRQCGLSREQLPGEGGRLEPKDQRAQAGDFQEHRLPLRPPPVAVHGPGAADQVCRLLRVTPTASHTRGTWRSPGGELSAIRHRETPANSHPWPG